MIKCRVSMHIQGQDPAPTHTQKVPSPKGKEKERKVRNPRFQPFTTRRIAWATRYTVVIRELGGKCQLGSLHTGSSFTETLVFAWEIIEELVKPMLDVQDVRDFPLSWAFWWNIYSFEGLSCDVALGLSYPSFPGIEDTTRGSFSACSLTLSKRAKGISQMKHLPTLVCGEYVPRTLSVYAWNLSSRPRKYMIFLDTDASDKV